LTEGWRVPASSRFEASIQERKVSRLRQGMAWATDLAASLSGGTAEAPVDAGPVRCRVRITDLRSREIVHDEDWKGDGDGARRALADIQQDLERLSVAEFARGYGIKLGAES